MSLQDLFTREMWEAVGKELRGTAGTWWEENRDELESLAQEEVQAIASALRKGNTTDAKLAIAGRMSPEDFIAYTKGTTAALQGVARRRAELMDALEDLGIRSAKVVGKAIRTAAGL